MNKKGVVWETIADVFMAGFILFMGTSIFFLLSGMHQESVNRYFNNKITEINSQDIFPGYLNAESNGRRISDSVVEAYFSDTKKLASDLDMLLEDVYSTKVCWKLYKDDKEWAEVNKCKKEERLLNSSVYMPMPDKKMIKLSLFVEGYAK